MQYYDISRSFIKGMASWPGDTVTECEMVSSIEQGASVNVSKFVVSTHTGTHIDAPFHFFQDGEMIEQLALDPYWGKAQVVSVDKEEGPLFPSDFFGYDLLLAERLLIKTACSQLDQTFFPERIVYPSPELVKYISKLGIILFGTDAPSVDALEDPHLPGHKALLREGIAILEGLNLSSVPEGVYELVAYPLKIVGSDGAPCRAVLKSC